MLGGQFSRLSRGTKVEYPAEEQAGSVRRPRLRPGYSKIGLPISPIRNDMMDFDRFETRVMLLILVLLGAIGAARSLGQGGEVLYSTQFFRLRAVAFFAVAPSSRRGPAQHASKE